MCAPCSDGRQESGGGGRRAIQQWEERGDRDRNRERNEEGERNKEEEEDQKDGMKKWRSRREVKLRYIHLISILIDISAS